MVENNCPKSGVQGHQISSFESLQLQLHFCGSLSFMFRHWTAALLGEDQVTYLAIEWYQWCAPCCKSSVFISRQACLDWSFDNDTARRGANTNLTLTQCSWAHQDKLSQGLEESEDSAVSDLEWWHLMRKREMLVFLFTPQCKEGCVLQSITQNAVVKALKEIHVGNTTSHQRLDSRTSIVYFCESASPIQQRIPHG